MMEKEMDFNQLAQDVIVLWVLRDIKDNRKRRAEAFDHLMEYFVGIPQTPDEGMVGVKVFKSHIEIMRARA
ncbi:MAG: hypothetical protein V4568_18205 [Pseudomonadota bacterium]